MLVPLKCVVVCGSDLQRGHSGDGGLSSSILFRVMHGEWYGDCVVLSVVEVCADHGGVNVFQV